MIGRKTYTIHLEHRQRHQTIDVIGWEPAKAVARTLRRWGQGVAYIRDLARGTRIVWHPARHS